MRSDPAADTTTIWARLGIDRPASVWWVGSFVLFAWVLLDGARQVGASSVPTVTELPAVPAWLFLVVLVVVVVSVASGDIPVRGTAAVGVPVALGGAHAVAWWVGPALLRSGMSLLLAAVLVAVVVRAQRTPPRGTLTVAGLGAVLASVMLAATFVLDAIDAFADASSSVPPRAVDAIGPGLAAVAVLVGMCTVEQALPGPQRVVSGDVGGTVQTLLFGVGWVALVVAAGSDSLSLGVSSVGLHVLAVAVFLVRAASRIAPREALAASVRWPAAAVVAAAAYLGVLVHVVVGLVEERYVDSNAIPAWLEITVDLAAFAGFAGNGAIGLALRPAAAPVDGRAASAMFGLYNAGLLGAVVGAARGADAVVTVGWLAMAVAVATVLAVLARSAVDARPFAPGQEREDGVASDAQVS